MDPALLVPTAEVGMVGSPRAAGIRKDQDALGPLHEALRFGDISTGASPFEALLTIASHHQPAGPTRDFGHGVGSEVFDDRVERGSDGRQRAELLDQRIARGNGALAENGIALFVAHRLGAKIAVLVGEHLHQSHRKALGEVVDDVLSGTEIEFERFAFLVGEVGEAPVEHSLGSRDQLHNNRMVFAKRRVHRGDQARQFHREQKLGKEALLSAFEDRERCSLGIAVAAGEHRGGATLRPVPWRKWRHRSLQA
jgi:hypothetical protein